MTLDRRQNLRFLSAAIFVTVGSLFTLVSVNAQEADENGLYINKRPLKDWSRRFSEAVSSKKVDFNSPFVISISGTLALGKDGKTVIIEKPKLLSAEQPKGSDPSLVKLVEDAITSAGDSGWFAYLDALERTKGPKIVNLVIRQDSSDFSLDIDYTMESENNVRASQSALSMMIQIGQMKAAADDDNLLLSNTKVSSVDKVLKIHFSANKSAFWELIQRKVSTLRITDSTK